jgi:hypothetical protein
MKTVNREPTRGIHQLLTGMSVDWTVVAAGIGVFYLNDRHAKQVWSAINVVQEQNLL